MGESLEMDVILVSNAKSPQLRSLTETAIMTCQKADSVKYNFYVIEQCRKAKGYTNAKTLYYDFPFNYNRCLNLGIHCSESKYIALCNNDLIFKKDWGENMIQVMEQGYLSASPSKEYFDGIIKSYRVGKHLLGWCIVINREVIKRIGKFDESVEFWFSDDIYAEQIKKAGIEHILNGYSNVIHLTSKTLIKIKRQKQRYFMRGQSRNFHRAKLKYK